MTINQFNQNIGNPVPNWKPCVRPSAKKITGQYCTLELLDLDAHGAALFEALQHDNPGDTWTYLPETCSTFEEFRQSIEPRITSPDNLFYTIFDVKTQQPLGMVSYLRIQPEHGSIEIGYVHFSKRLQKRPAATEAIYLMIRTAFELHYRRCEWKCHSLNEASRKAALRFGFQFEGIFRQANVYKGHNRDTAWYSIIDSEWPTLQTQFERWLAPDNFDAEGKQIVSLSNILHKTREEKGVAIMQHVFGDASTQALTEKFKAISPEFLSFLQGTVADIYGDHTLNLKTQEIIVLTSLITQKDARPQLKVHIEAALRAGLTQSEILALIKHLVLYIGFPSAINALDVAQEVFNTSKD
ncbi:MAG: GNAT family N-acetyltransferase [Gammaproteobacteria bacterium]|nr:GNAT family N-acetyltransferase [Gammaproteobacteria bacterium]